MAVTWTEVVIQVINFDRREVRLTCTIVDDDPETGSTRTYSQTGLADTEPHKIVLFDKIWRAYQQELTEEANLATVVADLQNAALDILNGRLA